MMVRRMAAAGASSLTYRPHCQAYAYQTSGPHVPSTTASCYEVLNCALQASSLVLLDGIPRPRIGRLPGIWLLQPRYDS